MLGFFPDLFHSAIPPAPDIPYKDESTKAITNNNMIDYLLELEYQFSI